MRRMRIAVLSDIHGNLAALQAVAADLRQRGVQTVVNLGDSLSGPLLPRETAQYLMAQDWVHLAGNHERQLLHLTPQASFSDQYARAQLGPQELEWVGSLQHTRYLTDEILLCHGAPGVDHMALLQTAERPATGREIEQRLNGFKAELILCGHTHVARSVRTAQGGLIVNPGSVGLQAFQDDHPYPHVVESGSPDARYAIVERGPAGWTVQLLTVPYAHEPMAKAARQRDRHDWAHALQTGYAA